MALVNLLNMVVLDNPTSFGNPFQFEITFECLQELEDDLEWKVIYVSSANDSSLDQTLEEVLVGPVPVGINKFVLQSDPPDSSIIPLEDVLGVTVVLVTCSYKEREFVRVGYYVNNEYTEEYDTEKGPPKPLDMSKVVRQILADKPRVTRFPIHWGSGEEENEQEDSAAEGRRGQDGDEVQEEDPGGDVGGEDDVGMGESDGVRDGDEDEENDDTMITTE